MATARGKSGGTKSKGKAKPGVKAKAKAHPKPKPRPKAAPKSSAAKAARKQSAKPALKAAAGKAGARNAPGKSAKSVRPLKPAGKAIPKAAAKSSPKPAVRKGPAPLNAGALRAKAIAEAAKAAKLAAVAAAKAAAIEAAKPKPRVFGKLVPATKAALEKAAMPPEKTAKSGAKQRLVSRPAPEVRPLGVLPTGSMAKPRYDTLAHPMPVTKKVLRPARKPNPQANLAAVPKPGEVALNARDFKHFEAKLLEARAKIMREMGYLESTILKVNPKDAANEAAGYSFHMADAGTDSMEREISFDLASKEGRLLREIDDALRRIYAGVYGICEATGERIARTRLEALPWARHTLAEQERFEKEQRAGRLPTKEE
ncbi:MAG: TraR/DksA C4-type zinc finger protein [Candidatus Eisenbacteria bacterium]